MAVDQDEALDSPEPTARAESGTNNDAVVQVKAIVQASAGLLRDFLELLAVEGRLAGRSLAAMLMLAVALALLLVSVWLFTVAALGFWLIDSGLLSATVSLLVVAAFNAVLALLAWLFIVRLSRNLMFREFLGALASLLPSSDDSDDRGDEHE